MMRPALLLPTTVLPLLLPALLGACAPRPAAAAPGPVSVQNVITTVSFYPRETGLVWSYVPEGEAGGANYVLKALGPTLFGTAQVQAFELTGRGAQQTWYRQIDMSGQKLLGFRKPGLSVTLSPPWQEWPAEREWKVGLTWSGKSATHLRSDDGRIDQTGSVTYRYEVLERRAVSVNNQTYSVWVVSRQISDSANGPTPTSDTIWFTPYVGDVRSAEGLLLTARNFKEQ